MEFDPSRSPEDLIRDGRDELRRALRRRPLPVVVLASGPGVLPGQTGRHALPAGPPLPPGHLGGWEGFNGIVTSATVTYGAAEEPGPWVTVETARWSGTGAAGGPLRSALEHNMRTRGERFSAVEWVGEDHSITVDGRTIPGHVIRAGDRWWAMRCSVRDLEISVVAHDWDGPVAVRTITELELYELISEVPTVPRLSVPGPDRPEPDEIRGEPHRTLVDAVLRSDQERAAWMADGGPAPSLPRNWPTLWRAAVLRQADLAGQPHDEAQRAIQLMINQLTSLQHQAAWFRESAPLRNRAISETLLFATGLGPNVPSRDAQLAWQRRQGTRPGEHARIESLAAAKTQWLAAWQSWADFHAL